MIKELPHILYIRYAVDLILFEQKFKGGFGVMGDDIIAAFFTLLVFALWRFI